MTKGKGLDSFQISFNNTEEFLEFLEKREVYTGRISVPAKNLKFYTLEQVKKWYKTSEELAERLGIDVELVKDTENNTKMVVVIENGHKDPYLLGSSSWVSIKNRIDIYGKGFDMLGPEEQVRDINVRMSQLGDEEVQVIIVYDKIRAIMSRMYAVVIAADFFKSVLDYSRERFDSFELVEAYADHNVTRCKILFTELREELAEIYKLPDEYIPGLVIQTSDTGFSANRIGAYWQSSSRGSFINSNEYINVKHKGEVTLEDILEELPNLFIKYQNTLKKFANLLTIEISQPVKVLKKACRHIGVAKKHTKMLVEELERELSTAGITTTTAYDICRKILSLPNYVTDSTQKTDLQEKVGRAVNINYTKLEEEEDE